MLNVQVCSSNVYVLVPFDLSLIKGSSDRIFFPSLTSHVVFFPCDLSLIKGSSDLNIFPWW